MDDRKAALELLGCLLTRPLELLPPGLTVRVTQPLDPDRVAEQLALCDIAILDPTDAEDLAHITAIAAIFLDLVENGLSKSPSAPTDVINCIVAQVAPPPASGGKG